MTKYLISFPGPAMDIPDEDMAAVGEAARAVIREAKKAGAYVFGGGINERDLPADQGVGWRLLCPGTPVARSRRPVGGEARQGLPLLAGTPRIPVRPRELTATLQPGSENITEPEAPLDVFGMPAAARSCI